MRSGPITKDVTSLGLGLAQIRVGAAASYISNTSAALTAANSIGALGKTDLTGQVDYFNFESGFPSLVDASIPLSEKLSLEVLLEELSPLTVALARGLDIAGTVSAQVYGGRVAKSAAGTTAAGPITTTALGTIDEQWTIVFTSASAYDAIGLKTGKLGTSGTVSGAYTPLNGGNGYFTIPANFFTGTWAAGDTYTFYTMAQRTGTDYSNAHVGSVGLGNLVTPAYLRMEALYTYPDGVNKMYIIFPRAQITSPTNINLRQKENAQIPATIEAKTASSDVSGGHAAWDSKPLGIIYWVAS